MHEMNEQLPYPLQPFPTSYASILHYLITLQKESLICVDDLVPLQKYSPKMLLVMDKQ